MMDEDKTGQTSTFQVRPTKLDFFDSLVDILGVLLLNFGRVTSEGAPESRLQTITY